MRVTGELPHAHPGGHLVIRLVPALEDGGDVVEVGIVDVPAMGIGHGHRNLGAVNRPDGGGDLMSFRVFYGVHDGEIFVRVGRPALQFMILK